MSAADIAQRLEGKAESGGWWRCLCPSHGGHSLSVKDGIGGRLIVHCLGGCATDAVLSELRRLGLLDGEAPTPLTPEQLEELRAAEARNRRRRIAQAQEIFSEGLPLRDTLADVYLRVARGTDPFSPYFSSDAERVLRFHPHCYHSPGIHRPALLARVDHVQHGHVATHCTYLALDGSGKTTLDPPRKVFGPRQGGAVQLAAPRPGARFCIGEGIESTLSVMISCEMPGWAALCVDGIKTVVLPPEASCIVVAADNDANGVGQRGAQDAAQRFTREGREAKVAIPPRPPGVDKIDFNDLLLGLPNG